MFSKESARQAEACRFCWMCRHICPVAGSTGNEGWTPRARGLLVSLIERGVKYDADIAEAMYHCTLCDACANDCATGYKPSDFIREARTLAMVEDIAPPAVLKAVDTLNSCGNIFGCRSGVWEQAGACPDGAEVLLYLGQVSNAVLPQPALSYMSLLKKAGVQFALLKGEPPSGAYLSEMIGFTGEVQAMAASAADQIAASGARTLVALNPADAQMFCCEYVKWGLLDGVRAVTATSFLAGLIESGALRPEQRPLHASLHEPVKLTRSLGELEPFKLLTRAAGLQLTELFLNGEMSRCIGTVPFDLYAPEAVRQMVRVRCEDALRLGSSFIITASPDDSYLMGKYACGGVETADIYDILDSLC